MHLLAGGMHGTASDGSSAASHPGGSGGAARALDGRSPAAMEVRHGLLSALFISSAWPLHAC